MIAHILSVTDKSRVSLVTSERDQRGFIRFKSLHCTQDVILHHCQSEASNLSGKMYRLAFANVQQGFTILVYNFGCTSSGINTIRFKEAKRKVCSQQPIPVSLASSLEKNKRTGKSSNLTSQVQRSILLCLHAFSFCKCLMICCFIFIFQRL